MFASDRDLLILEPNLFRDLAWAGQRLVSATGSIAAGVLTITDYDNDLEAAAVGPGHVAVVDGASYEILERLSPTAAAISRPRPSAQGPAIPPVPVTNRAVVISTFAPQLAHAHRIILRMLGIEPDAPPQPGQVTEADITNPSALTLAECLHALSTVYHAASTGLEPGVGPAFSIWQRAQSYRQRFEHERQRAAARIDLNGDGLPDATRRLNVIQLLRA